MVFEGQISGYGTVYVAFKVASINSSKNSGTLDGQGRTILENGTLISTPLKGTWKRMGANVMFYFTDAINNGAMNFVMWDVNLLKKKADVKYFELHEAEIKIIGISSSLSSGSYFCYIISNLLNSFVKFISTYLKNIRFYFQASLNFNFEVNNCFLNLFNI